MTSKINQENKEPNIVPMLKEANDSVSSSLAEVTASFGKFIVGMNEYIQILQQPSEIVVRGVPVNTQSSFEEVSLVAFENRAKAYVQFLNQIPVS
jgi:hypothetical protein